MDGRTPPSDYLSAPLWIKDKGSDFFFTINREIVSSRAPISWSKTLFLICRVAFLRSELVISVRRTLQTRFQYSDLDAEEKKRI